MTVMGVIVFSVNPCVNAAIVQMSSSLVLKKTITRTLFPTGGERYLNPGVGIVIVPVIRVLASTLVYK